MNWKKTVIPFCALAVLLGGCAKGSEQADTDPAETEEAEETPKPHEKTAEEKAAELLAKMSTADKAGQLISVAVRTWNEEDFTVMNEEVHDMFAKHHFGGICLFASNITADNVMSAQLNADLQRSVIESGGVPMLISADQEGGSITRLNAGTSTPGNMALAASGNPANAYKAADIMGSELAVLGINTDFAPDTDVNSNPANPVIGIRSFSDDPEMVFTYTKEFVNGLENNHVIPALKHFPGHGDTETDSHTGLPLIEKTKEELYATDLVPFERLIRSGYKGMIMSAHIQYPAVESGTYTSVYDGSSINLPATLSKTFLTDIVRDELGFEGVIITDAMGMDAIALHFDPMDAAALALNAGADMLLMPLEPAGTADLETVDSYMSGLIGMIEDGTVPMSRVDEAVKRILTLKFESGIMDMEYPETLSETKIAEIRDLVGSKAHHEAEIALSEETATVVENNGILPLSAEAGMRFLLVGMNGSQTNALGYAFNRLERDGYIPEGTEAYVISGEWTNNYGQVYASLEGTDVLILTDSMYSAELINTYENPQIAEVQNLINTAQSYGIKVIVISAALPYDLPMLTQADALMAVYNQTGVVECDENFEPLGAYGPNLIGAMNVIFGKVSAKGKLPVNIPSVVEGRFEQPYAYSRGEGLTW